MDVVVVDDSPQFRRSFARLLSSVAGISIVGYAQDVDGARKLIDDTKPALVVLDVELQGGGYGIQVLRHVAREHPLTKVVALSNLNWQALRRTYLDAGAQAYFDKSMEFQQARDWIAACARCVGDGAVAPAAHTPPDPG
jgi:DNA-binding NarL/FixJ family response regulator